jgi:SAM-dependent methyltransferase
MVQEVSKSLARRSSDRRYATRWFVGDGIDIGAGDDPLSKLASFLPLMGLVRSWDRADGDAMLMQGVDDETYDFVHSSHALEHMGDPTVALRNWIRICRKGGHLIITVPDEDLYEQGVFPSTFNSDHKWTFTIGKAQNWCSKSINIIELLGHFVSVVEIIKIELLDSAFIYGQERQDQTKASPNRQSRSSSGRSGCPIASIAAATTRPRRPSWRAHEHANGGRARAGKASHLASRFSDSWVG